MIQLQEMVMLVVLVEVQDYLAALEMLVLEHPDKDLVEVLVLMLVQQEEMQVVEVVPMSVQHSVTPGRGCLQQHITQVGIWS